MNVWNFTGNLGNAAEQRFTTGGESVVSFSVAVKSGYGDKQQTTWVNCALWGKRGDAMLQYLGKGQLVGISGEATLRKYDRKEGGDGYSLDVRVNDLTLLGGKKDAQQDKHSESKANAYQAQPGKSSFDDMDDNIPFN